MLFNSIQFAIFFPIVVALFYVLPQRWRVHLLLGASCIFYMAFIPAYIAILFVTILIDYVAGIYIERGEGSRRKALLFVSIVSTCTVLAVFKYMNFLTSSFAGLAALFGWHLSNAAVNIILPVGLSFHTFQSLSYVVEVYRGKQKAERNFIVYATYVMFFPQLVAGPIERPQNLLHQFREWHRVNYVNITSGLKRMAWGFFKKLVVADRLALYVNDVYGAPRSHNGLQLSLGTLFFAYQIYCDFSGYSDIALGAAQVMGFKLMENFRTPYHSLSVSEFWRRWHISLSTWFKDYVYIPLGGRRVGHARYAINILITFGISGLWHGASWTYVWWGLLNGVYLVVGWLTKEWRDRFFSSIGLGEETVIRKSMMWASTFLLTCAAWVVFRAKSLQDAWYVFSHLLQGWNIHQIKTEQFLLRQMPIAIAAILVLEACQLWFKSGASVSIVFGKLSAPARLAAYAALVLLVVMFGIYRKTQFIYFQF